MSKSSIYLQEPKKTKKHETGQPNYTNNVISMEYVASSMQGWRTYMEDAHYCDNNFDKDTQLFCVFDGHGGFEVAKFAAKHFPIQLKANQAYKAQDFKVALEETFLKIDEMMQTNDGKNELRAMVIAREYTKIQQPYEKIRKNTPGCTANVTLIHKGTTIYVANAGDSRCVISCNGKQEELSHDHKPQNPLEKKRILEAGGSVNSDGRINGNLNLSRCLGDFHFKTAKNLRPEEQIISAMPDIIRREISPSDEFLLIGCDGVWELKSNQELIDICRIGLIKDQSLVSITENLLDQIIAKDLTLGRGQDNMTMILVKIKNSLSDMEERKQENESDSIGWSNEDIKNICLLNEENNDKDEDIFEDILSRVGPAIKQENLIELFNVRGFICQERRQKYTFEKEKSLTIRKDIQNILVIKEEHVCSLDNNVSDFKRESEEQVEKILKEKNPMENKENIKQEKESEIDNKKIEKDIDKKDDRSLFIEESLNNSPCELPLLENYNSVLPLEDPSFYEDQKPNGFQEQAGIAGENQNIQNIKVEMNENELLIKDDNKISEEETATDAIVENVKEEEENDSTIVSPKHQFMKENLNYYLANQDLQEEQDIPEKRDGIVETKKQKKIADKFSIAITKQTNLAIQTKLIN